VAGDAAEEGDGRRRLAEAVIKQIDDALGELRRRADHGAFSGYGPVEVNDLVRRAIEIVQTRWTAGSQDPVRLEFQPLGEAMVVRASLALAGALAHAIDNAVEAAGQGGQVQVSTYRDDGHVVISVADSGPGIPEERREEAFAPFISTKSPPHIGLGLSVVRAWMLKHGGQVDLVPRGDGGTELVLRLPALREVDRTDLGA
jgi:signal transduction histidine kinase